MPCNNKTDSGAEFQSASIMLDIASTKGILDTIALFTFKDRLLLCFLVALGYLMYNWFNTTKKLIIHLNRKNGRSCISELKSIESKINECHQLLSTTQLNPANQVTDNTDQQNSKEPTDSPSPPPTAHPTRNRQKKGKNKLKRPGRTSGEAGVTELSNLKNEQASNEGALSPDGSTNVPNEDSVRNNQEKTVTDKTNYFAGYVFDFTLLIILFVLLSIYVEIATFIYHSLDVTLSVPPLKGSQVR